MTVGDQQPLTVAAAPEGYSFPVPPQITDATLRLAAGDVRERMRIEPVHRPELAALEAEVTLPAYLEREGVLRQDIRGGAVAPVKGSMVAIIARANRPLAAATIDGLPVEPAAIPALTARAWSIRRALEARGITGDGGETIDHVMLLGPPAEAGHDGRAFVLCPDGAFDRSPCGTGTSALVGCLFEDGMLEEGRTWRQESVLGGVYEASVRREGSMLVPTVRGRAWISAETTLHFAADDPYRTGLGNF
jgi:hypothetical protein